MECGLLGRKLGHSYSPQIHGFLGDYSYQLFEKEPEEVEDFLKNGAFTGLNVTIPYKKTVIPCLDALSPTARKLGAVNTIVRRPDGSLIGHNTDYFGFETMLKESGLKVAGKKALVLGSGGASNTAVCVLREQGAQVIVISRSGEDNYENLARHADAAVIVNATPVGMYPSVDQAPLTLDGFPKLEGVLDVIYNPARTKLLQDAESRGLAAMNGLLMLVAQAKESAEWFTGQPISDGKIREIHQVLRGQMENIILIGMPGCGKTTIGTLLARKLNRPFADADTELEARAGRKITDIIPNDGEEVFRALETETLDRLARESGLVIATGGGCVTKERNYPLLHRNGTIVWIQRDPALLPTDGRPLSQSGKLRKMLEIRGPMYQSFCDITVVNDGLPEEIADRILDILRREEA